MYNLFNSIMLIITVIIITFELIYLLNKKKRNQLASLFSIIFLLLLVWSISLLSQLTFSTIFNIPPIYFDYFAYIGICILPVMFLLISIIFSRTRIEFNKKHLLLFIIPILSLLILWTNDFHHLFYKVYSTDLNASIYGPYMAVHSIYSYILYGIGLFYLLRYSIKNLGVFSKQAILIIIGSLISISINLLGFLGLISISIYVTPVSFSILMIFISLAIFKFDFLKVTPIALQRIVDRMSDGYIIVDPDNVITDFNETFLSLFSLTANKLRNVPIKNLLKNLSPTKAQQDKLIKIINSTKNDNETKKLEIHFSDLNKYFNIEINSITNKGNFLGTLILFKDITQHKEDMQIIKNNQEILIERERLASLGQMIGGIAHNLKTPIMSISGAAEGLSDLINEYKDSVGDPQVTVDDHKEIAGDMKEWVQKIQTHLEYMSDVITTVRGQAVAFADNKSFTSFTIDDLIRQINILMKHELSHALVELEENLQIPGSTVVNGNINSLVQVINNIISNAIQAYNGKTGEKIILDIYKENSSLVLKVQDFAGGIPDSVKSKLFKEMTTTKGKNGTGLGLFMSYSNIKAHFNGTIYFETRKGKGTSFYIEIPV